MSRRRPVRWMWASAAALWVGAGLGASPMAARTGEQAAPAPEVTFTKHIAPILQRSCENCHRTGGVAPMALQTYEQVRPWARSHQGAHRHRPARRRDAAVVRREGNRHPALQERPVAQRRRKSRSSPSGPTPARRAATRPTCRRRGCGTTARRGRSARPTWSCKTSEIAGEGHRARLVGRDSADADRPHRGPLRGGPRSARSQRRRLRRHRPRDRRRPLRLPPHDLADQGARRARGAAQPGRAVQPGGALRPDARHHHLAGARSRPRGRLLRSEVGAAAQGRLVGRQRLGAPALERPRHQVAPRDRLQVHAEGLQARVPHLEHQPRQRRRHRHQGHGRQPAAERLRRADRAHQDPVVRAAPARARARACASKRRGATRSRRSTASATTTTGCAATTTTTTTRRCCPRAPCCTSSAS